MTSRPCEFAPLETSFYGVKKIVQKSDQGGLAAGVSGLPSSLKVYCTHCNVFSLQSVI